MCAAVLFVSPVTGQCAQAWKQAAHPCCGDCRWLHSRSTGIPGHNGNLLVEQVSLVNSSNCAGTVDGWWWCPGSLFHDECP